jgi:hypothetical protein
MTIVIVARMIVLPSEGKRRSTGPGVPYKRQLSKVLAGCEPSSLLLVSGKDRRRIAQASIQ